ncbi:MAG: NAD-dependent epimerase/dehydratase family protein [Chthoniobacterales bacterium]
MRVLITGGAGFIGSHVAEHFQGKADVRILDNLRTGYEKNLKGLEVEFINGSILDREVVNHAMAGVDYVFHLAAMISVPESMQQPKACVDMNVTGLLNVLEAAKTNKVRKLVFASSAAIYGNDPEVPKVETMRPQPQSPYAITKLDGEYYCSMFTKEGWLNTAALRFFNVFGPRQDPNSAYAAAIPAFVQGAICGKPITIFGDGEQTRDFIYVKDIVSGLVFAVENDEVTGVFNCGYGAQMTVNDLAKRIIKESGSTSTLSYAPVRAGDVKHSCASVEKLKTAGWKPVSNLDEGLAATVAYFS